MVMKVKVLSDLHLEVCEKGGVIDPHEGDILILAGDILTAKHLSKNGELNRIYSNFLNKCVKNFNHVLYVMGNHEHYGYHLNSTYKTLRERIPKEVKLLENETIQIGDWFFIGMTMWTDFNNQNSSDMFAIKQMMNDYHCIRVGSEYRKLQPYDLLDIHKESRLYLYGELKKHENDNVFMITHHAPCSLSISDNYKGKMSNCAYYTDFSSLILQNPCIKYWVHGHVHHKNDYVLDQCRIISNPRGYYAHEYVEGFDENFEIELS